MPTDKPRIQVYLNPDLLEKIKEFKEERKVRSDSEATALALEEFFSERFLETERQLTASVRAELENLLLEKLQPIQRRLSEFEQRLREFKA